MTVKKIALLLLVVLVVVASATPALAAKGKKDKKKSTPFTAENAIIGNNEDNDKVIQDAYNTGDVCNFFAECVQSNDADFDTGANLGRVQETGPGNLDGPITTVNDQTAQQGNQIGSGNQNQDFTDQNNVGVIEDND